MKYFMANMKREGSRLASARKSASFIYAEGAAFEEITDLGVDILAHFRSDCVRISGFDDLCEKVRLP